MHKTCIILSTLAIIISVLSIVISKKAHADPSQLSGTVLAFKAPPLTGDLLRNGVAIFAPELNQMLKLQRDGRATLEITPIGYTFSCIDPLNACVIR